MIRTAENKLTNFLLIGDTDDRKLFGKFLSKGFVKKQNVEVVFACPFALLT